MCPMIYHVTCVTSQRKKLVKIDSKAEMLSAVKKTFALSDLDDIWLQAPFEDDWLDVDDLDDLPNGGKLQFIIRKQGNFCSAVFMLPLFYL